MRLLSCTPGPKWLRRRLLRAMCDTLGQGGSASIRVDIAGGHATVPRHEKRSTSDVSNVRFDNIGGQKTMVARTLRCTSKDANECRAIALRQCRDSLSPLSSKIDAIGARLLYHTDPQTCISTRINSTRTNPPELLRQQASNAPMPDTENMLISPT